LVPRNVNDALDYKKHIVDVDIGQGLMEKPRTSYDDT
jgi:hypothetical protein